nr:RNA-directed DNA polymerase, eukaryota [Tanacetum cinerariifolium]
MSPGISLDTSSRDNDEDTDTEEDIKEGKLKGEDGESPFLEEVSVGKKDSRSEDPLNIYELLNKNKRDDKKSPCVNDSFKYPSGFIHVDVTEGSLKKDDGFNREDDECSQSIHVDEKEDVAESFCFGHFKKFEAPHTGGSIVELIDDLVKVGLTMGYNMDGCIKNMGMIIDPQRANEVVIFLSLQETKMESIEFCSIKMCWGNFAFDYVHSASVGEVIIKGDFNEVRTKDERFGSVFNKQGVEAFNMFISNTSLEEVPLGGCSFTWCHKYATKMSKLDHFLISESLMIFCPNIFAVSLDRYLSDHRPILLPEAKYDYGPILFRFFHYLFEVGGLDKLVEDTWNEAPVNDSNAMSRMLKKLKYLKEKLRTWTKEKKRMSSNNKVRIQEELSNLDIIFDKGEDDAGFVGQWSDPNIDIIVHVLDCFYRASGLCINMNKSKLMGVAVEDDKVVQAVMKIGCVTVKASFSYLGSKVGGSMLDTDYNMSIFKVPMKVLQRLESIRCHFFNGNELLGKKPIWVKWKSILASKEKGGLGVSSLYALNRALMFKWVWRFFTHGSSLWARVIKAIHGVDGKIGTTAKATFLSIWVDIIRKAEKIKGWRGTIATGCIDGQEVSNKSRWVKVVPITVNIHAWKVRLDCLPTRLNISRRGLEIDSILCPTCDIVVESTRHIFFTCHLAREIFRKITCWWDVSYSEVSSYEEWFYWTSNTRLSDKYKNLLEGVCYISWWHIWTFHNKSILGVKTSSKAAIFEDVVSCSFYWCRSRCKASFSWID